MWLQTRFPNRRRVSTSVAIGFAPRRTLGLLLGLATVHYLVSVIIPFIERFEILSPCRQLSGIFPFANIYTPCEVVESKCKRLATS